MTWNVVRYGVEQSGVATSDTSQLGFAEAFVSAGLSMNRKLERLDGLIDWAPIGSPASETRPSRTGRPPCDALSMLKALYLQAL